jgi:hypothetical protein
LDDHAPNLMNEFQGRHDGEQQQSGINATEVSDHECRKTGGVNQGQHAKPRDNGDEHRAAGD